MVDEPFDREVTDPSPLKDDDADAHSFGRRLALGELPCGVVVARATPFGLSSMTTLPDQAYTPSRPISGAGR